MAHRERGEVARSAAAGLEAFVRAGGRRDVLVGFDGFIDSIIRVVDRRKSLAPEDYEAIATIPQFAARAAAAAGKSANIELVVTERRFGGNGPLLAGAIGHLGGAVTYIGAVGTVEDHRALDPIYEPFASRCVAVHPIASSGLTDALEFDDGKLMLGKPGPVQVPTWELLVETFGVPWMRELVGRCSLVGIVNWVMMVGVEGIWRGLIDEVFATMERDASRRRVFLDLADPAKRTDTDVARALGIIREMDAVCPVTLGLNLSESQRIAQVCGAEAFDDSHNVAMGDAVRRTAESIRGALGIECVVVHPREGAAAADATGASAWFDGPFTHAPKLSTGAGDHFNGGFSFAQIAGLPIDECLAVGCAVSGAYVRDAQSPTLGRLCGFLRDLPGAE